MKRNLIFFTSWGIHFVTDPWSISAKSSTVGISHQDMAESRKSVGGRSSSPSRRAGKGSTLKEEKERGERGLGSKKKFM